MEERKPSINSLQKGLFTDVHPSVQPEGTYRFALNAVNSTVKGEKTFRFNESSNVDCFGFVDDEIVVGSVFTNNNESVIFVYDKNLDESIIYLGNHDTCTITELLENDYLNFKTSSKIQAEFRVRNGCERWVYFVDGENSDKAFNLDAPAGYYSSNPKLLDQTLYGNPYTITLTKTHNTGGSIPVGTIQIAARYKDIFGNNTEFFGLSLPIPITVQENDFVSIIGKSKGLTNRSIEYQFSNLDTAFSKLEIAVVETSDGISNAYIVDELPITSSTLNYLYTGRFNNKAVLSSLNEVVQNYTDQVISKTITQKDNRLIKANVKTKSYDWLKFQREAVLIESKYVMSEKKTQTIDYSANNPVYYFNDKSHMRDEVYAFGLRWVMKDGTKSPVLHIPGRKVLSGSSITTQGDNATIAKNLTRNVLSTIGSTEWDLQDLAVREVITTDAQVRRKDVEHLSDFYENCTNCDFNLPSGIKLGFYYNDYDCGTFLVDLSPDSFLVKLTGTIPASEQIDVTFTQTIPSSSSVTQSFIPAGTAQFSYPVTNVGSNYVDGVITVTYTNSAGCVFQKSFNIQIAARVFYNRGEVVLQSPLSNYQITRELICSPSTYGGGFTINLDRGIFSEPAITNTCTIPRWKVYNTAIPDSVVETGYVDSGYLAYHESSKEVYPEIVDCDGNSVFGEDNEGEPVRFHKFPDAQLCPIYTCYHNETTQFNYYDDLPTSIFPLGIKFSNINPPAEYANDVDYYEIVRAEVDESIIDKGILSIFRAENYGSGNCEFVMNPNYEGLTTEYVNAGNTVKHSEIITPKGLITEEELGVDYLKLEHIFGFTRKDISNQPTPSDPINLICERCLVDGDTDNSLMVNGTFKGSAGPWSNRKVNREYQIKYDSQFKDSETRIGTDISSNNQRGYFVNFYDDVPYTVVLNADPTAVPPYKGDSYVQYVSLKKVRFDQYYNLESLRYIRCQNNYTDATIDNTVVFGGDAFIGRMEYLQTFNLTGDLKSNVVNTSFGCGTTTDDYAYITRVSFFTESRINTEIRTFENNEYFYPYVASKYGSFLDAFDTNIGYHLNEAGDYEGWNELFYKFNKDYSFAGNINVYASVNLSLGCAACEGEYPHNIIYSDPSNPDDLFDNYRVFLINNYLTLPGNKGEITRIFPHGDYLVADCERTRYVVSTGQQELDTTTETIFIGKADYLSNQVREISDSNIGFLGNQSQFGFVNCEFGVLTIDQLSGKVFITNNNSPKPISSEGMHSFFRENLPSKIQKQYFDIYQEKYPFKDIVSFPYGGEGVIAVYDSALSRVIISKKDFKLTSSALAILDNDSVVPTDLNLGINSNGFYTNLIGTPNTKTYLIPEEYPEYFENHSWTISYSFEDSSWVSFHSYLPDYYIDGLNDFISGKNLITSGYKHYLNPSYQRFYDELKPFIVELTESQGAMPVVLNNIKLVGYCEEYDSNSEFFSEKPELIFNKCVVYNSRQSTGEQNLVFYTDAQKIKNVQGSLPITHFNNFYNINQFKDLVVNHNDAIFETAWNKISNSYFLDKLPNTSNISKAKSWIKRMDFRDRFYSVRLIQDAKSNLKIGINFSINFVRESYV
jgi:hypothetical protein